MKVHPDVTLRQVGESYFAVFVRFPGRLARLTAVQYHALRVLGNGNDQSLEHDGENAEWFRVFIRRACECGLVLADTAA